MSGCPYIKPALAMNLTAPLVLSDITIGGTVCLTGNRITE